MQRILALSIGLLCLTGCKSANTAKLENGEDLLVQTVTKNDTQQNSVVTVKRGDFTRTLMFQGSIYFTTSEGVFYEGKRITTIFDEFVVRKNQFVKKDDPIAKIHYEVDTVEHERLKLEVKRLKEKKSSLTDSNAIAQINEELSTKQELLDEYDLNETTDYIYATSDGVISNLARIESQSSLNDQAYIAVINRDAQPVIIVDDANQQLRYGLNVSVDVTMDGEKTTYSGTVISGDSLVSEDQKIKCAFILLDCPYMASELLDANFIVNATTTNMKDVLLIDVDAVKMEDFITYVNCLEDGKVVKHNFLNAGSNSTYYWVLDGLTEGMTVLR